MDGGASGRRWLAVLVWSLCWGLCLAAIAIELVGDGGIGEDAPFFTSTRFFVLDLSVGLVNAPAAALVLARTRHPVGLIAGTVAVGFSLAGFGRAWGLLALEHGWPGAGLAVHAFTWAWLPGAFLALTAMPWYLREDLPPQPARRAAAVGLVLTVLLTAVGATHEQQGAPPNPLGIGPGPLRDALDALSAAAYVGCWGLAALAVGHLAWRWFHQDAEERRALTAIVIALGLLLGAFATLQMGPTDAPRLFNDAVNAVLFAAQVLVPLSILALVLRRRMWGIDVQVSRASVWVLLTSIVVALYAGLVWLATLLLPVADQTAGVIAAAGLALAVQPVRRWVQRRVERLVYGPEAHPVVLLARLGEQLRLGEGRDTVTDMLEGLRSSLRLGSVEVVPPEDSPGPPRERFEEQDVSLPLVVEGRHLGDLRLRPPAGERLDRPTVRVAEHLVAVVAVAVDLAQANERLREVAARLGHVRHEERRQLRRDLHDGLGPALAGVGLGLAAARRRVEHDPDAAARLLAELESELARRTDDLRLLARSMLPAELDDGDLGRALAVLAERFAVSGLAVRTEVDPDHRLDAAQEIAVYQVASEALLNAHRHACATRVVLTLRRRDGDVVLEVRDDGVGIASTPTPGVGLRSMRERAQELSGTLRLVPGPRGRGTTVCLRMPGGER